MRFEFNARGVVQAWQYFQIGTGKIILNEIIGGKHNNGYLFIKEEGGATIENSLNRQFVNFWVFSTYIEGPINEEDMPTQLSDREEVVDPESAPNSKESEIFEDDEEGCLATYNSFGALLRHIAKGKHVKSLQRYRVEDYALVTFIGKIEEIDRSRTIPIIANDLASAYELPLDPNELRQNLPMGWAHKSVRQNKRFSDDAISFLDSQFEQGERSSQKMDPTYVSNLMKSEILPDGTKRFRVEDRLTARQVASYFSRKSSKLRSSNLERSKRNTDTTNVMDDMMENEGDATLEYMNDPMFIDEFDELMERIYQNKEELFHKHIS